MERNDKMNKKTEKIFPKTYGIGEFVMRIAIPILVEIVRIMFSDCSVAALEIVGEIASGLAQVPMDTWMEWGDEIGNAYDRIAEADWDITIDFSFWN